MSKKNKLDQYYTSEGVVREVMDYVLAQFDVRRFMEPSAGEGIFLQYGSDWLAYDLEPKHLSVVKADFLEVDPEQYRGCVAVGNPPFGFAGSLAVKFINRMFESVNDAVLILPNTFHKDLFFDRNVRKDVSVKFSWVLPKNSFILNGKIYDVPCSVFHLIKQERWPLHWERKIERYTSGEPLIIKRVGGRAGKVTSKYTESSCYKLQDTENNRVILSRYSQEIEQVSKMTAGVRSITLDEIDYIVCKGELNEF